MPAGEGAVGYVAFAAVKFVGYVAASEVFKRAYEKTISPWKAGLVRTVIGIVFGAAFGGGWIYVVNHFQSHIPDFVASSFFFVFSAIAYNLPQQSPSRNLKLDWYKNKFQKVRGEHPN